MTQPGDKCIMHALRQLLAQGEYTRYSLSCPSSFALNTKVSMEYYNHDGTAIGTSKFDAFIVRGDSGDSEITTENMDFASRFHSFFFYKNRKSVTKPNCLTSCNYFGPFVNSIDKIYERVFCLFEELNVAEFLREPERFSMSDYTELKKVDLFVKFKNTYYNRPALEVMRLTVGSGKTLVFQQRSDRLFSIQHPCFFVKMLEDCFWHNLFEDLHHQASWLAVFNYLLSEIASNCDNFQEINGAGDFDIVSERAASLYLLSMLIEQIIYVLSGVYRPKQKEFIYEFSSKHYDRFEENISEAETSRSRICGGILERTKLVGNETTKRLLSFIIIKDQPFINKKDETELVFDHLPRLYKTSSNKQSTKEFQTTTNHKCLPNTIANPNVSVDTYGQVERQIDGHYSISNGLGTEINNQDLSTYLKGYVDAKEHEDWKTALGKEYSKYLADSAHRTKNVIKGSDSEHDHSAMLSHSEDKNDISKCGDSYTFSDLEHNFNVSVQHDELMDLESKRSFSTDSE